MFLEIKNLLELATSAVTIENVAITIKLFQQN